MSSQKKKKFFSFSSLIKTLESMPVPLLPLPPLPPPPLGDEEGEELEEKEREGGEELLEIGGIENAYTNEYDTRTSPSSCDWSEENILAVGCDAGPFVLLIVRFVVSNSFLLLLLLLLLLNITTLLTSSIPFSFFTMTESRTNQRGEYQSNADGFDRRRVHERKSRRARNEHRFSLEQDGVAIRVFEHLQKERWDDVESPGRR